MKRLLQRIIRIVQKVLITVCLVVVYVIGLGVTRLFVFLFRRRTPFRSRDDETGTYWKKAAGYEADLERCVRQS